MRKILLLAVLITIALSTQARKVKFRVNMTGQTVSANGIHLAGNFRDVDNDNVDENPGLVNWSPNTYALTGPDANGIYSIIMDLAGGYAYEFKYINDNDWPGAENVPSESQVGGGNQNRWIYIPSSNATDTLELAALMFGGNAPTGMKLVRFNVNMANETVNADGVHVAGAFQGWDPSSSQMVNYAGNGAFSGTTYVYLGYVATGTGTEFKYVNDNDWAGAESVPSACNVNGNRAINNINSDTTVLNVCFASCEECPTAPIPVYDVTFQVDMSATCVFDSVDIAGGKINNWSGGTILRPISAGSSIFAVTVPIDSGEVEYKFRKYVNGNVSWEGVANRIKNISSDTTIGLVCFDKDTLCTALPAPANVHFIVDLSNEIPDPNGDIYVMGNFTEPNWQSGAIKMTPVAGQIGVYEAVFNNMCPGTFAFKFCNGPTSNVANEESFPNANDRGCVVDNGVGGYNRSYERTNGNAVTLGFVYNSCSTINVGVNNVKLDASAVKLYPNPTEGTSLIQFNDNSKIESLQITDLTGRIVREYNNVNASELSISTTEFESGIYFITILNVNNEIATVKLMVR